MTTLPLIGSVVLLGIVKCSSYWRSLIRRARSSASASGMRAPGSASGGNWLNAAAAIASRIGRIIPE
jgi:hypothetical protein